jgi:hypothetical protein
MKMKIKARQADFQRAVTEELTYEYKQTEPFL